MINTVYAVCRLRDYSLVNIHETLDAAIAQVTRLEGKPSFTVTLTETEDFDCIKSFSHVIQPYGGDFR